MSDKKISLTEAANLAREQWNLKPPTVPIKFDGDPDHPVASPTAPAMPTGIAPGNGDTPERKLLVAAYDALRSYQFGNGSTELAEEIANAIGLYFSGGRP